VPLWCQSAGADRRVRYNDTEITRDAGDDDLKMAPCVMLDVVKHNACLPGSECSATATSVDYNI